MGRLLVYYQQRQLFRDKQREFRPYEVESPLWVLLGSSVSRKSGGKADKSAWAQTERADVAKVLAFLKRFLEDGKWAVRIIGQILQGKSGFADAQTGHDLFAQHLDALNNPRAAELYREIAQDVFHGRGGLEVWELIGSSGELGLRVPAPSGQAQPYFGVVLKELTVPTLPLFAPRLRLPVPRTQKGYDVKRETWTVEAEELGIVVDLMPRLSTYDGRTEGGGLLGASRRLEFDSRTLPLLDLNDLYLRLLQHKAARGYDHFFLPRAALSTILQRCEVRVSSHDASDPRLLAEAAERALRAYLDRYVSRTERRAESSRMEPGYLFAKEQPVEYRVRTSSPELYKAIQELLQGVGCVVEAGGVQKAEVHDGRIHPHVHEEG